MQALHLVTSEGSRFAPGRATASFASWSAAELISWQKDNSAEQKVTNKVHDPKSKK
jgi:hypothetical protein